MRGNLEESLERLLQATHTGDAIALSRIDRCIQEHVPQTSETALLHRLIEVAPTTAPCAS